MFSTSFFIFALVSVISVKCEKKICDFEDIQCMTNCANRTFAEFISGKPGVESSDPLHQDLIEGNMPTLQFKIADGFLYGMKNCNVEFVKISIKDLTFNYHVVCPHLILESRYEVKGQLRTDSIVGSGTCKVDYYDYHFYFNGDYEKNMDGDGKTHIHLKNHTLELEAKGKINYDFNNLSGDDNEKSAAAALNKFANENWKFVDKQARQPIMDSFMNKYIDNVNAYLKITPLNDLFSYEN